MKERGRPLSESVVVSKLKKKKKKEWKILSFHNILTLQRTLEEGNL